MDKNLIIDKIKVLAIENGGKPPGAQSFAKNTGIQKSSWFPHIWLRWSDALTDAGFDANEFGSATSDDKLFTKYAEFVRELGRMPVYGELQLRKTTHPDFPSTSPIRNRGGMKPFIKSFLAYCSDKPEFSDVAAICRPYLATNHPAAKKESDQRIVTGYVYLIKSGTFYKIGRTVSVERREREIGLIIPNLPKTLHWIETDDPAGVEAYWHRRFADKRTKGEWFNLSQDEVNAFKRWKKLV